MQYKCKATNTLFLLVCLLARFSLFSSVFLPQPLFNQALAELSSVHTGYTCFLFLHDWRHRLDSTRTQSLQDYIARGPFWFSCCVILWNILRLLARQERAQEQKPAADCV